MRYEVRQQDEKWIVWDTVNDCVTKAMTDRSALSDSTRHTLNKRGVWCFKPNSVNIDARPALFWTQKEAQGLADILNDLDQSGFA